uniref:23S rRNA (Uracil(1939)-C(5))-methyltransferase RlmD n=1 Tax=Paenibacillus athensensis TaxID=1967502 RepID=A0A4Y8PW05_9BACL
MGTRPEAAGPTGQDRSGAAQKRGATARTNPQARLRDEESTRRDRSGAAQQRGATARTSPGARPGDEESTRRDRSGAAQQREATARTNPQARPGGAGASEVRAGKSTVGKSQAGANGAQPERGRNERSGHREKNTPGYSQDGEAVQAPFSRNRTTQNAAPRDGQPLAQTNKPVGRSARQQQAGARGASLHANRQDEQTRQSERSSSSPSYRNNAKPVARQRDFAGSDSGKASVDKAPIANISTAEEIKVGDIIAVTIKRIGINGEGVGYFRRKTIFVPGALPGEVVRAKAVKVESSYIQGALTHIEKSSPDRVAPPCPVYLECGGCQLQHLSYAGQLAAKEALVREAFERYTGIRELPLRPILGMDEPWSYRNKAQLQVGRQNGRTITGLYAAGTHRLVDISGCPIQHPGLNRVMREVSRIADELGVPVYDERKRSGVLRTVVARIGWRSQQVQLTLVTASAELPQREALVRRIRQALPEVVTLAQNVHPGTDSLIFGDETKILWGRDQLDEELGELRFALSPRAFFQLNPSQTVKLYDAVKEAAALTGRETVVDAYCGTGTIGLWLAPMASEVRGIELIEDAVADARRNAQRSGLGNARFYADRAERLLPQWVREGFHPDVVVVDPPRTGCEAALLGALVDAKPQRLVYVSCNPSTLAKDCKTLLEGGYRLEWVQPVDMFPQTAHVECVVKLRLENIENAQL